MIRAVGIDPGSQTGMICLDLDDSFAIMGAQFVGASTVSPSTSVKLDEWRQQLSLGDKIALQLDSWRPQLVVLEEPSDALPTWNVGGKGGRSAGTGTVFGLGRAYGIALARVGLTTGVERIVSYNVTSSRKKQRIGWMQGYQSRPPKREYVLRAADELLREIAAPTPLPDSIDENILMALGVLRWHCERERGSKESLGLRSQA